jgi:epoxyqueuosine reductase
MTPLLDTEAITLACQQAGFNLVSAIPAPLLNQPSEAMQHYLAQGYHADMAWLVSHLPFKRTPALLMEGTQTVVCVALVYGPDPSSALPHGPKIARYARGKDYHKVVRKLLKQVLSGLQVRYPSLRGRACCDSTPLHDKALAVAAGLGWQGKHGLIIHPKAGSWMVLGQLLLNLPLAAPSFPPLMANQCGRCTRCIDACPTDAIVANGVVDANRCIAYWTIENTTADVLPPAIAENLQGWLFGCDICQEVCPWNERFAEGYVVEHPPHSAFTARQEQTGLTVEDWLSMDEATFDQRVTASPLRRTGLATLKRNAKHLQKNEDGHEQTVQVNPAKH